jgi:hypothetical protein
MHLFSSTPRSSTMIRRPPAVTLQQATQDSPVLARLTDLNNDSQARLRAVESMIPAVLRATITAGPIDGAIWCLIVNNNAAAAKLRQMLPSLTTHLQAKGWEVNAIRLKVQVPGVRR